jgi:hypothetical protein
MERPAVKPILNTFIKGAMFSACLMGVAASAQASTMSYDFSTAGDPSTNQQAFGGTPTTLGTGSFARWVASPGITGIGVGDSLSASGTWQNNANSSGSGDLYFGIFQGPLTDTSQAVVSTLLTCDPTLTATCSTTSNITYTSTTSGYTYHLVFYSTAAGEGSAFKTGDTLTLTNQTQTSEVPVPTTAALLGLGLLGLGAARRKQA